MGVWLVSQPFVCRSCWCLGAGCCLKLFFLVVGEQGCSVVGKVVFRVIFELV